MSSSSRSWRSRRRSELLFEFGDSLTEGADFVGSGESGVVDDLCAKDFGQPLGQLGVLVSESFVVFAV